MNTITACLLVLGSLTTLRWSGEGDKGAKGDQKPKAKFTVGKETTYATGPLTKDGYINYPAALNKRLSEGVTPANNANVLLWKAFGPHPEGAKMPPEFFKWLGIEPPPERGDYFVTLSRFAREQLKGDPDKQYQQLGDELARGAQRPWTAKQHPRLAAWLKANEKPLALIVEASRRTRYFMPLTPKGDFGLIGALIPSVQLCREAGSSLTARAMLHLSEGRHDAAWQDLLACHRLARLVGRGGGTLIEGLVGIALERIVSDADLAFLAHAKLNAQQIKDRLRDLQRLPPLPSMADTVDLGERFMFLDSAMMVARGGPQALEGLAGGPKPKAPDPKLQALFQTVDWDPALRNANRWYDRLAAAMRLQDRGTREKQMEKLMREVKEVKAKLAKSGETIGLAALAGAGPTPEAMGQLLGDVLICLMLPAVQKIQHASDRGEQIQRNLHVAFALAAYRQDHGRYPKELEALAPKYLPRVPPDLFSGKALLYRPSEEGYLLYSVGINGRDEQGRSVDDDPPGDDLAVRMPLPELRRK